MPLVLLLLIYGCIKRKEPHIAQTSSGLFPGTEIPSGFSNSFSLPSPPPPPIVFLLPPAIPVICQAFIRLCPPTRYCAVPCLLLVVCGFFGHTSLFLLLLGSRSTVYHLVKALEFLWRLLPEVATLSIKTAPCLNSSRGLCEEPEIISLPCSVRYPAAVTRARSELRALGVLSTSSLKGRFACKYN